MVSAQHTMLERYDRMVSDGQWKDNQYQRALVCRFDDLAGKLAAVRAQRTTLGKLIREFWKHGVLRQPARGRYADADCFGIYVYGPVGTGKTQIMDWFWNGEAEHYGTRLHFYAFMREVHARIAAFRSSTRSGARSGGVDPLAAIGRDLAIEYGLVCLDEFFVQDIADAMILGRLFRAMLDGGAVIVCTSNCAPDELYAKGLQRERFLPFIRMLQKSLIGFELTAPVDYRMLTRSGDACGYSVVSGSDSVEQSRLADVIWRRTTRSGDDFADNAINVRGDDGQDAASAQVIATFPAIRTRNNAAMIEFRALCDGPYGAAQYDALTERYETIFVANIERLTPAISDLARRFVTFIDIAYEKRTHLIVTAHCPLSELGDRNAVTEIGRTISRVHALTAQDRTGT